MRFLAFLLATTMAAAASPSQSDLHSPLERLLDMYVREGKVYYRAMQAERGALDRYIASLDVPASQIGSWPVEAQKAFWINAYNAIVLRTVVGAYPIRGKSADYPPNSIRQVPGAFDRTKHRVGQQSLTLDEIESKVITGFGDARMVLALGRGALGSGRLRSEAYRAAKLEGQLNDAVKECSTRVNCLKIDRAANLLEVSPIIGWREELFVRTFAPPETESGGRSPIERAVVAMALPYLFQSEREFLTSAKFEMKYGQLDWRLNDLGDGSSAR